MSHGPRSRPVLITGQGLAGTCLAWELEARGQPCHLVDGGDPAAAWPAAAGIINPVTGKRLARSWAFEPYRDRAHAFYRRVGQVLARTLWHAFPLERALRTTAEAERLTRREQDPEYRPYLGPRIARTAPPGLLRTEAGGVAIRAAAQVDVAALVRSSRERWRAAGRFETGVVDPLTIRPASTGRGVRWQDRNWAAVVFADGRRASANPWFSWLDFRLSRGEILEAEPGDLPRDRILNGGIWTLPVPKNRIRIGSTYAWEDLEAGPTVAGRNEILENLHALTACRPGEVREQRAGVRPGTHDSRPYLGHHPQAPGVWIFNGLGSKGALYAPGCAAHLAKALLDGRPLPEAVDIGRRFRFRPASPPPVDPA